MGKFRTKLKGKSKGKKWNKGQSSISNPKTQKFREIAKGRFFQENLGNTGLTEEAVLKHNYVTTYGHGKAKSTSGSDHDLPIAKDFENMSVHTEGEDDGESSAYSGGTFKTFQTFASDWSTCSNVSFSKLLQRFDTNNALHKDMLAVLAAVTEVIKENGGKETTTEYFAALMETLKASDTQDSLAATLSLLAMGIKAVPQAVLRKQFSDCVTVFIDVLEKQNETDAGAAVLRSAIGCISVLLRAQEHALWSDSSTMRIFETLLAFTIHSKPKVRKASQHAVAAVLLGSCFMIPCEENFHKVPPVHPGAERAAKFCLQQMSAEAMLNGHKTLMHVLALLADIIASFPHDSIKTCCESLLSLMATSSVVIRVRALHTLHALLLAEKSHVRPPLVARLLRALHASRPPPDKNLARAWAAVVTQGLVCLCRLDLDLAMTCIGSFVSVCVTELWLADSPEVNSTATSSLKIILMDCVKQVLDSEEAFKKHKTTVQSIFKIISSGLDNPFTQAVRHVILTLAVCFEIGNPGVSELLSPLIVQLNERRESPNFEHVREVEYACACAVKAIGPDFLLNCIPLRKEDGTIDVDRCWLLPVLKEKIQNSTLQYFATDIIEMATYCRKRSKELSQSKDVAGAHTYELLCNQLWALFPSFCNQPVDLKDSFKNIAKVLGVVLKDSPEFRLSVMQGLRKLISCAGDDEDAKAELGRFAKNYLPILLNIYMTPVKGSTAEGQRLAALDTIQAYLTVSDQRLREELFTNAIQQLESSKDKHFQRESLLDVLRLIVLYQSSERIAELFDKWVFPLADSVVEDPRKAKNKAKQTDSEKMEEEQGETKQEDGGKNALRYKDRLRMCEMEHKKAFRILEEIFKCNEPNCKQFLKTNHKKIKKMLTTSLAKAADSSKAARLRCIEHLIINTPFVSGDTKLVKNALAEGVVCTKDINSKCRQCAFSLINTIARVLKEQSAGMQTFLEMIVAGLEAPLPRVVAATVRALAAVLFNYSEDMGLEGVQDLLEKVTELMKNGCREVVDASLSFLKVYTKVLPIPVLGGSLTNIVTALSAMNEDCKRHARTEMGYLLNRLIRKFGSPMIEQLVPKEDEVTLKRLRNLRKLESRKKRQREQSSQSESKDDDLGVPGVGSAKTLEDILADSDSDMEMYEDEEPKGGKGKGNNKSWIKDDNEEILDLADASAARQITATNPLEKKRKEERAKKLKKKDGGFKMAADGRLIITEDCSADDDDDEPPKPSGEIASDSDDTDDESKKKPSNLLKPGAKRRYDDILSMKSGKSKASSQYKPGGKGIHRQVAASPASVRSANTYGGDFKSKKARGDVKKSGKHDPYAYVPLSRKNLNKRKRAVVTKQFKGIVKAKHKGGKNKK